MNGALLGLIGVLIGALVAEYFRRKSRVESYAQVVFERRLNVYEGLYSLVREASEVASGVMAEECELNHDERHALISTQILSLAEYADKHGLFIDEEVSMHVVAMFMGAEDVLDIDDTVERASARSSFLESLKLANDMIFQDSGLKEIHKHYKSVSHSEPDSAIIQYLKEAKKSSV